MKATLSAIMVAAAMFFGAADSQAQSQFRKGDVGINLDYALGSDGHSNGATNGFSVMGEYGFMNVINEKGTISAGLLLGAGFNSGDYYDFSRVRIGTRGALHYSFIPQLDTYGGLNFLFVDIEKVKWNDEDKKKHTSKDTKFVAPAIVAGCRYMFCPAFGVNFETTWDRFQHINIGLTFKF